VKKLLAGTVGTVLALGGLGVATATPAAAATQYVQPSCSSLYVSLDGYPDGSTFTLTLDGETETATFDGSYGVWRDLDFSAPHDWSVVVDAPDDADGDFSDSGTTTPCDTDPDVSAWVDATCGELVTSITKYPEGSRVVTTIDGEILQDTSAALAYWGTWSLDWQVAHDWSVVLDSPDDSLDRTWSGTTEPCGFDPRLRVDVNAYCATMTVSVDGYPAGTALAVRVGDEVVGEGTIDESGYFWGEWAIDGTAAQEWSVEVDAVDDALDRTESGLSEPCWVPPTTVEPVTPGTVTDCAATPDDVVLPDDTEAISYARTDRGIVATASSGYDFPLWVSPWETDGDGRLVLRWRAVVQPRCDLEVVSVTPVCDAGAPAVDVVVSPPPGADAGTLEMDWVGPNEGYDDVVYGGGGFGQPFTSRQPWPTFVTHDDGTVSPSYSPEWRLEDVDLLFGVSVPVDGGSYSRYHRALWEDAPTADPCSDDPGPHFSVDVSPRWLAGKLYLSVRVLNEGESTADVSVVTPFGRKHFPRVAAGASAYQAFAVRTTDPVEGQVDVSFTADVDGEQVTRERAVPFWLGG